MSLHLLDSCALLWWMADAPELGRQARRAIADQRNEIIVSAVRHPHPARRSGQRFPATLNLQVVQASCL